MAAGGGGGEGCLAELQDVVTVDRWSLKSSAPSFLLPLSAFMGLLTLGEEAGVLY